MWLVANMVAFFMLASALLAVVLPVVWAINRFRVWRAEKRHRVQIEDFFDWFLRVETVTNREIIADIGWQDQGALAFVYPDRPGWFLLKRRLRSPQRYELSIWKVDGRYVEQFPPYGTTCHASWFTEGMRAMFNVLETWPREWLRSERALRVARGQPDPLYAPRPKH